MAARTMWRVRFQAIVEVEVEGEYAYDAREAATSAVSRLFDGASVESLSFVSSEQLERAPLKDRERIAREVAEAFPFDDDPVRSEDETEEAQEEARRHIPLCVMAEEPEGAKGRGGEGKEGEGGGRERAEQTSGEGPFRVDPFETPP